MLYLSTSTSEEAEQLKFEKLDTQDLSSFDCRDNGNDEQGLQEFIEKEALNYQQENLGVTYLILLNERVVAFLTVAMTSIFVERMNKEEKVAGVPFDSYPALLLGRLAVDNRFRHKQLGTKACSWCLGLARDLSKRLGCKYVVLHARSAVVPFYIRNFFILSEAEKEKPTKLLYRKVV